MTFEVKEKTVAIDVSGKDRSAPLTASAPGALARIGFA
jgi:hypothetical protein